jgi:predicted RND superfamily exporter protein
VAVIFGLAVATLLTLVVVPVLLSFQESLRTRRQRSDTENKTGHTDS